MSRTLSPVWSDAHQPPDADRGQRLVSSWNEWDPLDEVVVGRADNACFEPDEPACRPLQRGGVPPGAPFPTGPKPRDAIARANEELAGLVDLLEGRGITVRRPQPLDFSLPLQTPAFEVMNQYCSVCPRDVLITIGREIIEAPMSRRARYFEFLAYRHLMREYWDADPDMIWSVAPKPAMGESLYRDGFWDWPVRSAIAECTLTSSASPKPRWCSTARTSCGSVGTSSPKSR